MTASLTGVFSLQEFTDLGVPMVGGRLYTYTYGTTTHKTAYTDKAGTIPHTYTSDGVGGQYIALNARGELPAPLYLASGSYDIALKTSTGATVWTRRADPGDDASEAISAAIRADLVSTDSGKGNTLVSYVKTAAETTAGADIVNGFYPPCHPYRYGTNTTPGTTDMRAAFQMSIAVAQAQAQSSGAQVDVDWRVSGVHLIGAVASSDSSNLTTGKYNGLIVPFTADDIDGGGTPGRIRILSSPSLKLKAGADSMIVLRWCDSKSHLIGFPVIDGNGKANAWGVAMVPASMTQTTTCVFQCYNHIEVATQGCTEGLVMQQGPTVLGRDSGCWYNTIHYYGYNNTRHRWLKEAALGSSVATTRNTFNGRCGGGNSNTGAQYDSGAENYDYIHDEGITYGTSPNATPTARKILATPPTQAGTNEDNYFEGLVEASTRWYDNAAQNTHIVRNPLDESKCLFTVRPLHIEGRKVGGLQRLELQELVSTVRSAMYGPVAFQTAGNAAKAATISSNCGVSNTYNGLLFQSNTKEDGSQGNVALPSWAIDVGGYDNATYPGTSDSVSILRKPAGGSWSVVMRVGSSGQLVLPVFTVASLPSAATAYQKAFVSDANATTFNSIVAGGGANKVPVYSDGTNWRIG